MPLLRIIFASVLPDDPFSAFCVSNLSVPPSTIIFAGFVPTPLLNGASFNTLKFPPLILIGLF